MADAKGESHTPPGTQPEGQEHTNFADENPLLSGDEAETFLSEEGDEGAGESGSEGTGEGEGSGEGAGEGEGEGSGEGEGAAEAGTEGTGEGAGEGKGEGEGEGTGEGEGEPKKPEEPEPAFVPQYNLVDEGVTKEGLNQQLTDLDDKFNNGDLEMSEYLAQRDQARDQMRNLDLQERLNRQAAQQEQQQRVQQTWESANDRLYEQDPTLFDNDLLYNQLDQTLNHFYQNRPDVIREFQQTDNAGNVVGFDYDGILNRAASTVNEALGRQPAAAQGGGQSEAAGTGESAGQGEGQGEGETPSPKETAQARGKQPETPATLGGAPAAEGEGTGSSLDKLEGENLEETLAGMSESQIEQYLDQE